MNWNWLNKSRTDIKWFCIKLSIVICWLVMLIPMITCCPYCPMPKGICTVINFDFLFEPVGRPLLYAALAIVSGLYLLEKWMAFATFCWFSICVVILSHHESNGYYYRGALLSAVMAGQFIAYIIARLNPNFNLRLYRTHFGVQIICAAYTLSAIAKIQQSGFAWITDAPNFALQILKSHAFHYFTYGSPLHLQQGTSIALFFISHSLLIKFFFIVALLLEGFCFLAVCSKKLRIIYGIMLLLMHVGIFLTSSILIVGVIVPMLIFFLNPLYYTFLGFSKGAKYFGFSA